jgi:hypothetical protein
MSIQSSMSLMGFSNSRDAGRTGKSSSMHAHSAKPSYHALKTGDALEYDNALDTDDRNYSEQYESAPNVDAKRAWEEQPEKSALVQVVKQKYALRPVSEFVFDPVVDPTAILSVEGIRSLNPEVFDENTKKMRQAQWEDSFDPRNLFKFAIKCPLKMHCYDNIKYCEISFVLQSNGLDLPGFAALMNNSSKISGKSQMKLEIACPPSQLAAAFGCADALQLEQGHIIPKHIFIKEEHANLPIDMKLCLMSNPLASAAQRSKRPKKVEWSRTTGTHNANASDCGVCHIVTQKVCRMGRDQEKPLYIASDEHNSWQFPQYINTSAEQVREELRKSIKAGEPDMLEIRAGAPDMGVADSPLQYLAVTENAELIRLSHKHQDTQPRIAVNNKGQKVHLVSVKAMSELVDGIFSKIDREKMCMNLNGLSVVLSPLRGATQGKLDLAAKVDALQQIKAMSDCWFPSYTVTLCIAYSPCDHEPETDQPRSMHTSSVGSVPRFASNASRGNTESKMGFSKPSVAYPMPASAAVGDSGLNDDPLMPGQ